MAYPRGPVKGFSEKSEHNAVDYPSLFSETLSLDISPLWVCWLAAKKLTTAYRVNFSLLFLLGEHYDYLHRTSAKAEQKINYKVYY